MQIVRRASSSGSVTTCQSRLPAKSHATAPSALYSLMSGCDSSTSTWRLLSPASAAARTAPSTASGLHTMTLPGPSRSWRARSEGVFMGEPAEYTPPAAMTP